MKRLSATIFVLLIGLCTLLGAQIREAHAQQITPEIPNFWDKYQRIQKPDTAKLPRLKFLTTTDFPPFNFIDRKKRLTGFHVDLAREICVTLNMLGRCQIQALPWSDLVPTLDKGDAEAIIAGLAVSADARKTLSFSQPYLKVPARFVSRTDSGLKPPAYETLFRKMTGVVEGSAHEAYFKSVFSNRQAKAFKTRELALDALKKGEIDAVFSDALSLSFWLASEGSEKCCQFLDGAFLSETYFGGGMSIALTPGNEALETAINFALAEINSNGKFKELYLRYFPLGLF